MMIFLIKFVHSLVLLWMLGCLVILWQYGVAGLYRRWLPVAIGSIVLEALVWFGNGMRCPLTDWAIALGDETGADLLSEIIMPEPTNVVPGYAVLALLVFGMAGRREWRYQQRLKRANERI